MNLKSEYLGDGVYASSETNYPLIITTGHHEQRRADQVVFFEPEVLTALLNYLDRVKEATP